MKHRIAIALTALLLVALTLLYRQESFYWPVLVVIIIAFSLLITLGSYYIRFNYFIRSVNSGKKSGKAIALTFDDGPDEDITLKIADLLDREHIKATFFVIGHKAEKQPAIVKELHRRGHIIANHSYSHRNALPGLTTTQLKSDLQQCSEVIKDITGKHTRWFRPPFGVTTPRYGRVLQALNLQSIGWNLRSMDTVTRDDNRLFERVIKKVKPGAILLFHDTQPVTFRILPRLLEYCRTNGIKIVSLQELTELEPYGDF